jgi:hypothetical protein
VTYVMHGGRFGIDPHWCVLGIAPIATQGDQPHG